MGGDRRAAAWTPDAGVDGSGRDTAAATGPRWSTSLRALVVLLAMAAAAAGVVWLNQAWTSAAAGHLASQEPAKVAVPPLGSPSPAGTGPPAGAGPPAGTGQPSGTGPPAGGASATPRNSSGTGPAGVGAVVVHVAGSVRHPGVYTLPAGSRVQQAVEAAGGALPGAGLDALNLAAVAVDGTRILVPDRAGLDIGVGGAGGAGAGAADQPPAAGPGGLLNLNTATVEQLDALPGVGPVLAGRIIEWRTGHGRFTSVDELDAVSGIGAKMLANIRPLVTVR